MTNDLNNLSSFLPYDGLNKLHVGNGAGMKISHIGSTILCFFDYTISLKNVLFVPSFTENLVSLSQLLHDNELLIEFSSNFCEIKDHLTRLSLLPMVSSQQPLPPNPSLSTKNPASPADLPTSPSVPPSSLAGTPQVVVDSPPLIIYSRRSKLQSGASPAAADLPTFEYPSSCANQQSNRDPCAAAHVTPVLPPPPVHPMVTRSRAKQISLNHLALLTDSSFPSELRTYNQAKSNPNWIDAMQKEYVALLANHTCSFHIRTKCDRL
jgi:hypothetical protein